MRTRKKGLVRLTSVVAVVGIMVGVAALIVAQAVGRGFEEEVRDKILGSTAHVVLRRSDAGGIEDAESLRGGILSVQGVTEVRPTSIMSASLASEDMKTVENVLVRADGSDAVPKGGISVGSRLVEKFSSSGSILIVTGADGRVGLKIAGAFTTGIYEYDSSHVHISNSDFATLQGRSLFVPSSLSVSVSDPYNAPSVAEAIRQVVGAGHSVTDWQEANRPLFSALSLERKGALMVIALILLVAGVNITTTLSLLVNERRLDVAVFKTCGAASSTVVAMFVLEGAVLTATGIALGVALGAALCEIVNRTELLTLPAEVYSVSRIHLDPASKDALWTVLFAFAVGLVASLIPAVKSAMIKPVENLRRR